MEGLSAIFQHFDTLLAPVISFLVWTFPLKIYRLHNGQKGVILTLGKVRRKNAEVDAGIKICFCFEEIEIIQASGGYCDLSEQSVTTKNDKIIVFNGAISYEVINVQKAILETEELEELIEGTCMNELREYALTKNMEEIQGSENLTKGLGTKINNKLIKNHGVKIKRVMITDLRPHDMTLLCEAIKDASKNLNI